jgi:endo-1,4-beta-xylanase
LKMIATSEFNYVTPENEMKWGNIEQSRDNFNFTAADQIVNFASQNGMKVKGHTLVWHNQLPDWVQNLGSADEVRSAMVNHIKKVMAHFKGKVTVWDVVNEAWANPNDWVNGEPMMRNSVFKQKLGESFVDEAFVAARAADPDVKLYYNDFRSEAVGQPKGDAIYEMLKGMVERKVPIDGVGLQMHLGAPNDKPAIEAIIANMQRIADLGLEVVISEMDEHVCDGETPDAQGKRFHDIVAACVSQPACKAVTFWGIGDAGSWLNDWDELNCNGKRPAGLLWDDNLKKKPAYTGTLDALNGQ